MTDPMRAIRADVAGIPGVAAITTRVRRGHTAPEDRQPPGSYVPFVVLVRLDGERDPRTPVAVAPVAARCYGTSEEQAAQLWAAMADYLNNRGPRTVSGVLIYRTFALSDGGEQTDPDTQQPYLEGQIRAHYSTQAVA